MEYNRFNVYEGNAPYIFISYAHKDVDMVLPIIYGLQERGYRIWYDVGIEAGTEWPEYIAEHLANAACVIAFISEAALDSQNCRREINFAIELRKDPLVVYLEDVHLSLGMRMQLGSLQAMFRQRHNNTESFLEQLCKAQCILPCADTSVPNPVVKPAVTPPVTPEKPKPTLEAKTGFFAPAPDLKPEPQPYRLQREQIITNQDPSPKPVAKGEPEYQKAIAARQMNNLFEAARWFRLGADMDHPASQRELGFCYESGSGVIQDQSQALYWYRLAAEQDDAVAQCHLGRFYLQGKGVNENPNVALRWFAKSANQGNANAQCQLGTCYEYARGTNAMPAEAFRWYSIAAAQGHVLAHFNLGRCYLNGIGTQANPIVAVEHFRKAAELGNSSAQCQLGHCYKQGIGITKNDNYAVYWYQKAADQGHAIAQFNLGLCLEYGSGIMRNPAEAAVWYSKALAQGITGAATALNRLGYRTR